MEFPLIGGFAFAAVLSVVIEILKALGVWNENVAPYVNVIGGAIWVGLVLLIGQFPQAETWIVWAINVIVTLAGVPILSIVTYKGLVQPLTRKRFNTFDKTM